VKASPAFTVEIPELDDAAIERLAEAFVLMLDQFGQEQGQETHDARRAMR
jgi:hypothetical protein